MPRYPKNIHLGLNVRFAVIQQREPKRANSTMSKLRTKVAKLLLAAVTIVWLARLHETRCVPLFSPVKCPVKPSEYIRGHDRFRPMALQYELWSVDSNRMDL